MGGRTIKTGQSRWFVGYKKHTLRLWLSHYSERVLLVPLVSWLAPGNRGDALFLPPSVRYCARHLDWVPELVVGDMGYISQDTQRDLRQRWGVGVLTRLRPDMNLIAPFEPGPVAVCAQGQRLEWLGYEAGDHLHWFGVRAPEPCARAVGRRAGARASSATLRRRMKFYWAPSRWPRGWRNACCNKCVRGSNLRNPMRRTNWAWERCSSTACD